MKKVKNLSDEQKLFDCLFLAWDDTCERAGSKEDYLVIVSVYIKY